MDPSELVKTIYLGDRAVKRVVIDGFEESVKIQIDAISRIRSPDGRWNSYADEDIEDGYLVFGKIEACTIEPPGAIPDGYIGLFRVARMDNMPGKYLAELHTAGLTPEGPSRAIVIRVVCGRFHLEHPQRPDEPITA